MKVLTLIKYLERINSDYKDRYGTDAYIWDINTEEGCAFEVCSKVVIEDDCTNKAKKPYKTYYCDDLEFEEFVRRIK